MRLTRKVSGFVAAGSAAALVVGAIGFSGGIGAAFTDSATATANIDVGTLSCELTSEDPRVDVHSATGNHTATITLDTIMSSTGSQTAELAVQNSGSIPLITSWTASGGYGKIEASDAPSSASLQAGESQTVDVGFIWDDLGNRYQGKSATATFTVNCSETPNASLWFESSGGSAASWNGTGGIDLTTPGRTTTTPASWTKIHFTTVGTEIPTEAPTFAMTDTWTTTPAPVLYLKYKDIDGEAAFSYGYPEHKGGGWSLSHYHSSWTGSVALGGTWADVLSAMPAGAEVTDATILFNPTNANDSTITCIQYGGEYLVGSSPTC